MISFIFSAYWSSLQVPQNPICHLQTVRRMLQIALKKEALLASKPSYNPSPFFSLSSSARLSPPTKKASAAQLGLSHAIERRRRRRRRTGGGSSSSVTPQVVEERHTHRDQHSPLFLQFFTLRALSWVPKVNFF